MADTRHVYCPTCDEIYRVPATPAIYHCDECGSECQPHEPWDGGLAEGCMYERAFGDRSDCC